MGIKFNGSAGISDAAEPAHFLWNKPPFLSSEEKPWSIEISFRPDKFDVVLHEQYAITQMITKMSINPQKTGSGTLNGASSSSKSHGSGSCVDFIAWCLLPQRW